MCDVSAYVAFNEVTNGQTDKRTTRYKARNGEKNEDLSRMMMTWYKEDEANKNSSQKVTKNRKLT